MRSRVATASRTLLACLVLGAAAGPGFAQQGTLTVHVDQPGIKVSPTLYGIFFEEINRAGDGGLYAELLRNRSFEDADTPEGWTLVKADGDEVAMAIDRDLPLNDESPRSLRLAIRKAGHDPVGVANDGFWGIPLKRGAVYELSLYARRGQSFNGELAVRLVSRDGKTVYAKGEIKDLGADWKRFTCSLTAAEADPAARLVVGSKSTGTVWLDVLSLLPKETWKGRPNGLRPDLARLLAELGPAFVRFPGGCWVEGDTLATACRWKQTIGPIAIRHTQHNLWGYESTNGLGYHEYLQMCEDLGAEPLFVINCGMSHKANVPMDQMAVWVQDALDAIEYANGQADSQWGSMRARSGHPEPFNLKYMEIGNENGGPAYEERYALFHEAIKARYPAMHLVADVWGGSPRSKPVEIVDEHYYSSPEFFITNTHKYDSYDRKGPKVYVGEYAVTQGCGSGNLRGALGEAAFMTGLERNSDVVVMASYAPLFANLHQKAWNPDLIYFDASKSYGQPSYWVQQMFGRSRPDVILPVELSVPPVGEPPARHGAVGVGTWVTQAEYKDVKVVSGDRTLLECDFTKGAEGWKTLHGKWQVESSAYRQTSAETDVRAVAGDRAWTDYTYTLKARKLGGAEGFLILFNVIDDRNFAWWNLGGWGNSKHAIEVAEGGGKHILGNAFPGKIETDRWYDIRIEVRGEAVRCYLDGKLIHDATVPRPEPLHAVAGRKGGEVILKVVNVSGADIPTLVNLAGAKRVDSAATALILTGAPADENSREEPRKVAPVARAIGNAGPSFRHTFPANSLTILRLKAE